MRRFPTFIACKAVALAAMQVWFPVASAIGQTCDTTSDDFDWNRRYDATYSDCVAGGVPLVGSIDVGKLALAVDASSNTIDVTTSSGGDFVLGTIARGCTNPAIFDVLCARHAELLSREDGSCVLNGVYTPPSEDQLQGMALPDLLGIRRDVCSPFSLRSLQNPIDLSGSVYSISTAGIGPRIIVQSLLFDDLKVERDARFDELVVLTDLVMKGVEIDGDLILRNVVILGGLQITDSKFQSLSLFNVYVEGAVSFVRNEVSYMQSYDNFQFRSAEVAGNSVDCANVYSDYQDERMFQLLCGQ